MTQWVWTWGQFLDHTFGLAQGGGASAPISFDAGDPLESFRNDFGYIPFSRDAAATGTGTSRANPRQQLNTVSSFIEGSAVYGDDATRLEWLREGPVDGSLADNGPRLILTADGYLPTASARGDAATAPEMAVDGALAGHPHDAVVAGDVRANENLALTATHTLFAREHDRIVSALPASLPAEQRFEIARRVVGAEEQYVTYNEFLPAVGVRLSPYRGYRPDVNPSLGNEFATVAYRAHSMIHGEFEIDAAAAGYTAARLAALEAGGIEVEHLGGGRLTFVVPLGVAFFNPDLVPELGLGPILAGLAGESQYRNDEQIDNALRSLLFQVPGPGSQGVIDLGALDVQRGRDHGMPGYNALRRAYGLAPRRTFAEITGERSSRFPADPQIDPADPIDDPDILDFTALFDAAGNPIAPGSDAAADEATNGVRRAPLAARLRAIYGDVDRVDAFVGMVSEPHPHGGELGQLQAAIWRRQFEALRDGDRFFYLNDPALERIRQRYGISYRHSLAELIALDSDVPLSALPADVFRP
ncbi:MAG: peroxidase [Solirubrobacterales bacterium]|nr:peroxidase [Solirubrobacterales bacterium]